tara:strand:+ start:175 stop:699 length:525 start_codon:yes stop_codon:yes gene_type:complete
MSNNTITLDQLNSVSAMGSNDHQYTPENNAASYAASLMTSVDRGTRIESVIHKMIQGMGYTAHQTAPTHAWDITLDLPTGPVKIEVKSAMMGTNASNGKGQFMFQNISPDHFDYIVFAFVHPTQGIVLKWLTQSEFTDWSWNRTESRNGYNLVTRETMDHRTIEFHDFEDFPEV